MADVTLMQLEQPPPDLAIPEPTPFDHLRPSLWRASKVAHITLVSLGTVMLIPAAYVMIALVVVISFNGGFPGSGVGNEEMLLLITAVGSTSIGVLAWCALSLLFFKRNDARWQRICWAMTAVFGVVASPCIIGWIVWLSDRGLPGEAWWVYLIFIAMLGVAVACLVVGARFSIAAKDALRHPPTEEDRSFL